MWVELVVIKRNDWSPMERIQVLQKQRGRGVLRVSQLKNNMIAHVPSWAASFFESLSL